jgi:hypothetical protein
LPLSIIFCRFAGFLWGYLYFLVRAYCEGDDGSDLPPTAIRRLDWQSQRRPSVASSLCPCCICSATASTHSPVPEQQIYKLRDPTVSKGSRRVQFDYEPTIYSEGLWVMEARVPTRRLTSKRSDQSAITRSIPEVPQSPNSVALRSRPRGKGSWTPSSLKGRSSE